MEGEFTECERCRKNIPTESYKDHLVLDLTSKTKSNCLVLFCQCRHCKRRMPIEEFRQHIRSECSKLETYCQFDCTHWSSGETFEVKDELDHYLNKCSKLRSESQKQEVLRKNARCPVCMRLALE